MLFSSPLEADPLDNQEGKKSVGPSVGEQVKSAFLSEIDSFSEGRGPLWIAWARNEGEITFLMLLFNKYEIQDPKKVIRGLEPQSSAPWASVLANRLLD